MSNTTPTWSLPGSIICAPCPAASLINLTWYYTHVHIYMCLVWLCPRLDGICICTVCVARLVYIVHRCAYMYTGTHHCGCFCVGVSVCACVCACMCVCVPVCVCGGCFAFMFDGLRVMFIYRDTCTVAIQGMLLRNQWVFVQCNMYVGTRTG